MIASGLSQPLRVEGIRGVSYVQGSETTVNMKCALCSQPISLKSVVNPFEGETAISYKEASRCTYTA